MMCRMLIEVDLDAEEKQGGKVAPFSFGNLSLDR
jgi:hypothetical protein